MVNIGLIRSRIDDCTVQHSRFCISLGDPWANNAKMKYLLEDNVIDLLKEVHHQLGMFYSCYSWS